MTSHSLNSHIAFFPGTFDPFTRGHESIVNRALKLFDKVVIGIGINPDKTTLMSLEARMEWIRSVFRNNPRVEVVSYSGYTVDAARQANASCMVRGVRNSKDFEYEQFIADFNSNISDIETILLFALPGEVNISSSEVRTLIEQGEDISQFLPSSCDISILPAEWQEYIKQNKK